MANAGFKFDFQFVDVPDFHGRGEMVPTPYFFQNLVRPLRFVAFGVREVLTHGLRLSIGRSGVYS